MNKRIVTIVAALVAVVLLILLGLPYYLGIKAQQSLDEQRALLAKNSFLLIEKQNYERGWFSSTETMQIRFKPSFLPVYSNSYRIMYARYCNNRLLWLIMYIMDYLPAVFVLYGLM